MRKVVKYYGIKSDHLLAMPEFTHEEVIECDNEEQLVDYIQSQTDDWGNSFKKESSHGYDYISRLGGVKVNDYVGPVIKKISTKTY